MTADTAKPSPEALAEQESKNAFLQRLDDLSQEMIDAHGEDFTMGVLILGARYIAEKKAKPEGEAGKK